MLENLEETADKKPYLHNPKDITESFKKYYQTLFEHKHTENMHLCLDVLKDPHNQQILSKTATLCSADITEKDIINTALYLPAGKSPGPDRIPNKFYRIFIHQIANCMTTFINDAKHNKTLPHEIGDGIISVLFKKNERTKHKNYRPITLLNGDYKIFTRIMTKRLNNAVRQFVSPQQNGFVPDGFIAENTMLLNLIKAHAENTNHDLILLFL